MAGLSAMREDAGPVERILVATDGSPSARVAVEAAVDLASVEDAELIVVYVVARSDRRHPGDGVTLVAPRYLEVSARDVPLHEAAEQARRRGVSFELVAMSGEPLDAILDAERTHRADIVVVGSTRSRNPLRRALPDLARGLTRRARSDVIVVNARGA